MNLEDAKVLTVDELKEKISKEEWFKDLPEEYKPNKIKYFERMVRVGNARHLAFLREKFGLNKIVID
jgi:hypothetical protein